MQCQREGGTEINIPLWYLHRHWRPIIISQVVMMPTNYLLNECIINNLCWSSQLISFQFPQYIAHSSHTAPHAGPQVKDALSKDCRSCTCSFLSLKRTFPPLPSIGPLCLNLDMQGCCVQICRLFTRQEWAAQEATRGTNICLGPTFQLYILVWACICPEKGVSFSKFHKRFQKTSVLPGGLCRYPRVV